MFLLGAFILGFVGSLHCIGMCGPLVLAVPSNAHSRWKFVSERLWYHTGRSLTYTIMGAVVGAFGSTISLLGIQQQVSIIAGVVVLLSVLIPLGLKTKLNRFSPLTKIYSIIKMKFGLLLQRKGNVALFGMGFLNGLLPCGLVYTALVGATAVAEMGRSAVFMLVFGIGTIPALVGVSLGGKLLSVRFRPILKKLLPAFSILVAVILILRGMNLGIPMVSPKMNQSHHHEMQMP